MLSGVTAVCFATSYSVVLALEISRLAFRSGIRGAVMIGFATAGLLAHSAFLYYQALRAVGSGKSPLSSEQDWYLLAAWVLVVVYLYLVYYHPQVPFGLFLMPLVLGLIAAAVWLADPKPFAREPALKIWGVIHGVSILLGAVSVLLGFVAGLMYLRQARRLKHKLPPARGLRLPSLEWLDRTNSRAIVISVVMLGLGVASGVILKFVNVRSQTGLPWHDPVVLSTFLWFGWLVIALVLGKLYRPIQQGRKVAYLTVVSFVFLVIVLVVGLFVKTQHRSGEKVVDRVERTEDSVERTEDSGQRAVDSGPWTVDRGECVVRFVKPRPLVALSRGTVSHGILACGRRHVRWFSSLTKRLPTSSRPMVAALHPKRHYPLPTTHYPLSTPHSPRSSPHSPRSSPHSPQSSPHCPLSSVHCPLSTPHSPPATGGAA